MRKDPYWPASSLFFDCDKKQLDLTSLLIVGALQFKKKTAADVAEEPRSASVATTFIQSLEFF
jgi:hypothetical protein